MENHDGRTHVIATVRAGDIATTPEPSTFALAGLGLAAAGLARRRSGLHKATRRG